MRQDYIDYTRLKYYTNDNFYQKYSKQFGVTAPPPPVPILTITF